MLAVIFALHISRSGVVEPPAHITSLSELKLIIKTVILASYVMESIIVVFPSSSVYTSFTVHLI